MQRSGTEPDFSPILQGRRLHSRAICLIKNKLCRALKNRVLFTCVLSFLDPVDRLQLVVPADRELASRSVHAGHGN